MNLTKLRAIRIGSRSSPLARWQSHWVAQRLIECGLAVEIVWITTEGDVTQGPIGGTSAPGLFTKEIQRALLEQRVDLAVHSLKDLPTESIAGLHLAAVPPRERSGDALLSLQVDSVDALPPGARVGTGSARRQAQLLHWRADLRIENVRGNVDTRLRKLDEGQYDAILLAEAGLLRLGLGHRITAVLPPQRMLPAVGQGALGLEVRADDSDLIEHLGALNDPRTQACVSAERAMLAALRGGCLAPVGAWTRFEDNRLRLDGVVLSRDGANRLLAQATADEPTLAAARAVGERVAEELLRQGAGELIAAGRRET